MRDESYLARVVAVQTERCEFKRYSENNDCKKKIYVLRFFITSFKDKQELSSVFHLFTILTEVL